MNAELGFLRMAGWLAAEVAAVVLLAVIGQAFVHSAHWRRTMWQACALSVLLVAALELSGAGRAVGEFARSPSRSQRTQATPPAERIFTVSSSTAMPTPVFAPRPVTMGMTTQASRSPRTMLALACIWILGTGLLLCRTMLMRAMMLLMLQRGRPVNDSGPARIVQGLAPRLGIRGRVRVMVFPRLKGPIAFGLARRMIGLPPHFEREYSGPQQEVILAHELAHLAARDNSWQLVADVAVAVLWWHPLVWLARRRLQGASETAADEASLLVQNGPPVLAECLLAIGKRMESRPAFGWLNIGGQGFRSGLGRRVQRLCELSGAAWKPASRVSTNLARLFCPAALVLGTVLCSGWLSPGAIMKGTEMKNPMWKRSLPAFAVLAFLATEQPGAAADKPALPTTAKSVSGQKNKGAAAVRRKLEQIVLKEVRYDNLPLAEVIRHLIAESEKQDVHETGVNFLLKQFTYEMVIDSATGLPKPSAEPLDLGAATVRIMPTMRNLRLIDALDAIVKVSDPPVKYSIEEYGVVITAGSRSQVASSLETRTFQIQPPDIFYKGIESAFGIAVPAAVDASGVRSREAQQQIFEELFLQLGIQWGAPKSIFYNELTGIVMVRAAEEDMVLITATMQTLGGSPITEASSATARVRQ